MSPGDVTKLFAPLWASVIAAMRELWARAIGWLPKGHLALPGGIPAWAVVGVLIVGGWAAAEALAGLLKNAVRIAVLVVGIVLLVRVLG
jgi:hypothetical protein